MTDLNSKAKAGIKALLGRQVAVQIVTFLGGVVLARTLGPSLFGVFAIATTMVSMVAIFGDFGLSASLIQRKVEISDRDIQVGFTLQQVLVSAVVGALLVGAPLLAMLYPKEPRVAVWLVRALAFNLYLASWRSMSVIQLERQLNFGKVAKIEVIEQVVYQVTCVVLALLGFKIWSFVVATLVRGVTGTVLAYRTAPWPIKFAYDRTIARDILAFGIPMQLNYLFLNVSGWVTPLVGGQIIGPTNLGYVTFASANGKKPLMIVDSVMRASFPHLSRIQDDLVEVERLVIRYLTLLSLPTTIWFVLLVAAGKPMVELVYTTKFSPAVTALCIFAACCIFETFNWVGGMAQEAIGLAKIAAQRAFFRSVAAIIAIVALAKLFGFNGVAAGSLIVGVLTIPWSFTGLPKGLFFRVIRAEAWLVAPVSCGIALGLLAERSAHGLLFKAFVSTVAALVGYAVPAFVIGPKWFKDTILSRIRSFAPSKPEDLSRLEVDMLEFNESSKVETAPLQESFTLGDGESEPLTAVEK